LEIKTKNKNVIGVKTKKNGFIKTNYVSITSGTYMNSLTHVGLEH
jgi:tRNA U34 5-carboxymethylaminomethyl modifying enzyme MnmG/GidA